MVAKIRHSTFAKILWGLMGAYLLNISVDTADPNPERIPEDLSFNDQESIVEVVVEQLLGFENAIEEYDDHDTEDYHKKKTLKIDLLADGAARRQPTRALVLGKKLFDGIEAFVSRGYTETDTPPPKA